MHTALWVVAGVLAAAMLLAGALKLWQSKDELLRRGIHLPERFSNTAVKALGPAEVLAPRVSSSPKSPTVERFSRSAIARAPRQLLLVGHRHNRLA
jgi:hypothetical protein